MRGGGKDASTEGGTALAAEILNYTSLIDTAIQRLMLTNDCKDTQISFWTDTNNDGAETSTDDYYNPNAPMPSRKCHVFQPQGGGVSYQRINPKAQDPAQTALPGYGTYMFGNSTQVINIGTTCPADNCTELLFFAHGISASVCRELSKMTMNYDGIYNAQITGVTNNGNYRFRGVYKYHGFNDNGLLGDTSVPAIAAEEVKFIGKPSGCFKNGDGVYNAYDFYHVLIPR